MLSIVVPHFTNIAVNIAMNIETIIVVGSHNFFAVGGNGFFF